MSLNKFLVVCVILSVIVSNKLSFSQLVDQVSRALPLARQPCQSAALSSVVPEKSIIYVHILFTGVETTDTPVDTEAPSTVICTMCVCADGVVNCTNLNISAPFELTDWDGLASFNPITVDLSVNPLSSVTRIGKLPIQVLNLSNTNIETLEDGAFIYLEDIKTLDLSRNKIATSDLSRKVFCGPIDNLGPHNFGKMDSLSLAYNDIHSLPQDLFMFMPTLRFLDLSGNPLGIIDQVTMGALSDLVNLRTLSLSGCELESLPDGLLRRQRKLRRLDLSNNRFTTIPSTLQDAPNLVFLSLDKNAIQAINGRSSISNLTNLQELRLCRMSRLQNITAGALGGIVNLSILRLCYNPRLTNLDPHFLVSEDEEGVEQWPALKELYLNNNNLSTINSHILDSWNDLVAGDFSYNPFVCDCKSQWMVDVLTPLLANTPNNNTVNHMICKKPADVRGLTFAQLNNASKTLVCTESEKILEQPVVSNLAIILGIMIGIIVTFPIVLVVVLLWKKGYFARCREDRKNSYPGYYDDENERL